MKKKDLNKEKQMNAKLLSLLQENFMEDEDMDSYNERPCDRFGDMMEADENDEDLDKEKKKNIAIMVISKRLGKKNK